MSSTQEGGASGISTSILCFPGIFSSAAAAAAGAAAIDLCL
jgi:hypothetical protein